MKIHEAKLILNKQKLGKSIIKWDVPHDLKIQNRANKGKALIGIGRWKNTGETYICIAQGKELIYIEKPLWLIINDFLKNL